MDTSQQKVEGRTQTWVGLGWSRRNSVPEGGDGGREEKAGSTRDTGDCRNI